MNHSLTNVLTISLAIFCAMPAQSFETQWMARVVEKGPCIESLGPVVSSQRDCWSWTKGETARPAVDLLTSTIFVGGTDGLLHVLDAKSGRQLHRTKLDGNLVSAPVFHEGSIVFGTDRAFIYSLSQADRTLIWKTEVDSGVLQGVTLNREKIYAVSQLGTLYALAAKTGEILWSKKRELPNRIFLRHLSAPTFVNTQMSGSGREVLTIGNPNGKLEFFDLENGDLLEEIQLGNVREPFADVATRPIVERDMLYAAAYNVGLVALDRQSRVRKWELSERGITQLAASNGILVAAGAKFVLGVEQGSGRLLWRYSFDKGAPGPISLSDSAVFIGSDTDALYVLDLFSGRPREVLGSGLGFASGIERVGENIIGMSSAGVLFLFSPTSQVVSKKSIARN